MVESFVILIPFGAGDNTQFQIPARSQIFTLAVIGLGQFGHLTGDTQINKDFPLGQVNDSQDGGQTTDSKHGTE